MRSPGRSFSKSLLISFGSDKSTNVGKIPFVTLRHFDCLTADPA